MTKLQELFPGHYAPSEADLSQLWKQGTFVVDANVLLQLYALPETTRNETLMALDGLGERLWMPYQVAVEYQRNRVRAIGQARDRVTKVIAPLTESLAKFEAAVADVQLEKRGLKDACSRMVELLSAGNSIIGDAQSALESQVDLTGPDPIREAIGKIYADRIGPAPLQVQLDAWYAEAKERYRHKLGPGFEDASKKDPTFRHGSFVYNKVYGDYVIWRQTIAYMADLEDASDLVFVTQDRKPDWWLKHNERLSGPHPELIAEMRKEAKLDRFWMYDLEEFLQAARTRMNADVSETTLHDVADANLSASKLLERAAKLREIAEGVRKSAADMSARLREQGVKPDVVASYYAAGRSPDASGTWTVATDARGLGQFVSTGSFGNLVRILKNKGAEGIEFYCYLSNPISEFQRNAYEGFIAYVMEQASDQDMIVVFHLQDESGEFDVVDIGMF